MNENDKENSWKIKIMNKNKKLLENKEQQAGIPTVSNEALGLL